jgi:hypothetical protein
MSHDEIISVEELFSSQKKILSEKLLNKEIPLHRPPDMAQRNALRLMGMVHELHKQGWQRLRIHSGMAPSGCYWRCAIFARDLTPKQQERYYKSPGPTNLVARYTSGQERHYFDWADCEKDDSRHLAQKFLQRFPKICKLGLGRDWAYAGWFTELLGHAENGRFPISYWDGMTDELERAVWLSFGDEIPFPLPPPRGLETEFWPTTYRG